MAQCVCCVQRRVNSKVNCCGAFLSLGPKRVNPPKILKNLFCFVLLHNFLTLSSVCFVNPFMDSFRLIVSLICFTVFLHRRSRLGERSLHQVGSVGRFEGVCEQPARIGRPRFIDRPRRDLRPQQPRSCAPDTNHKHSSILIFMFSFSCELESLEVFVWIILFFSTQHRRPFDLETNSLTTQPLTLSKLLTF